MTEREIAYFVKQVIAAISYLHSKDILHREFMSSYTVSNSATSISIIRIRSNLEISDLLANSRTVENLKGNPVARPIMWRLKRLEDSGIAFLLTFGRWVSCCTDLNLTSVLLNRRR